MTSSSFLHYPLPVIIIIIIMGEKKRGRERKGGGDGMIKPSGREGIGG